MTASLRLRYLAGIVLALSLTWAVGPSVTEAKGPAPKPEFTISVSGFGEGLWWGGQGVFTSSGGISDAGEVYYVYSYYDPDGRLMYHCLFVGMLGSFEAALPDLSESGGNYLFELTGGTGEYDGLYGAGATRGSTRKTFFWYNDDMTIKKWKWSYVEFTWTMKGTLSP